MNIIFRPVSLIIPLLLLFIACGQKVEKTDSDDSLSGTPVYGDIATWQIALEIENADINPTKVLVLPDSSILIGGEFKNPRVKKQILLIKLDPKGNLLWHKELSKSLNVWVKSMARTDDGGFILLVQGSETDLGPMHAFLMKVDAEGNYRWDRKINEDQQTQVAAISRTKDSNYVIAGAEASTNSKGPIPYLLKTDSEGTRIWKKSFPDIMIKGQMSLLVDLDGGFVISSPVNKEKISGDINILLFKTDANGKILWKHTYGGAAPESCYSLQAAKDGGYWISGTTQSMGEGEEDAYLVRVDNQGDQKVEVAYGDRFPDAILDAVSTTDGGIIATGYWRIYPQGMFQVYVIKINKDGEKKWDNKLAIGERHQGRSIASSPDGGFVIACSAMKKRSAQWQTYVVKFDGNGNFDQTEPTVTFLK